MIRADRARALPIAFAVTLAAAYLGVALFVLARGFPHEDAFILFKYANQLGCGHGVVFYPGGPHAEGGTDFLWLAALGAGRALGIDPAISAALWNAFGVAALGWLLATSATTGGARSPALAIVPLLLVSSAAVAGYVGFSAPIYGACALGLYRLWARGDDRAVLAVPLVGLLLGLIRPDGVLLAAGFSALAAHDAWRRDLARPFAVRVAVVALIGGGYFLARRSYFGAWLPLPLYVKSHYGGTPPGLEETIAWCLSTLIPLGLLVLLGPVVVGPARPECDRAAARRRLIGLAPFAVHVLSFVPAVPSQNIAARFQAPATLALLDLGIYLVASRRIASPARAVVYLLGAIVAMAPQLDTARKEIGFALSPQYVNLFAADLGTIAPDARVAATEAGRIPFYTRGPALDLVGLDSPDTARRPPTHAMLDAFAPDLVMLHHAGTLDERAMDDGSGRDVVPLTRPLEAYMAPAWRRWLADPLPPYDELHAENVVVTPVAVAGYLDAHLDRYELYAVRFQSRFFHFHVYALRRDWPEKERVLAALRDAHRGAGAHDYLELLRARGEVCAAPAK